MSSTLRRSAVALCTGALLIGGAGSASAAPPVFQGGLINVAVGDVTILEDVNVAVAALVAANICGIDVNVLAAQLANEDVVVCENGAGQEVTITD